MAALIAVAWGVAHPEVIVPPEPRPVETPSQSQPAEQVEPPAEAEQVEPETEPETEPAEPAPVGGATLPGGRRTVFGGNHFLVAYYGTAGTGALG
eukprot:gene36366-41150_t